MNSTKATLCLSCYVIWDLRYQHVLHEVGEINHGINKDGLNVFYQNQEIHYDLEQTGLSSNRIGLYICSYYLLVSF
mgnify:CR=1 FL=1